MGHQYTLSADGEVGCFLNKSVAHLMILELCFSRLGNLAKWQGLPPSIDSKDCIEFDMEKKKASCHGVEIKYTKWIR